MIFRRLRWKTLRIALLTSLIWVLAAFFILFLYLDCIGPYGCNSRFGSSNSPESRSARLESSYGNINIKPSDFSSSNGFYQKYSSGNIVSHDYALEDISNNYTADGSNNQSSALDSLSSNQIDDTIDVTNYNSAGTFNSSSTLAINDLVVNEDEFNDPSIEKSRNPETGQFQLPPYKSSELRVWHKDEPDHNPSSWPGEMGKAVIIPKKDEKLKNEEFKLNQFNLLASDRIALNRSLSDVRLSSCRGKRYAKKLPPTSIIIVFHNEAWSTLLRTIHSIIRTSPPQLLHEIILVDDASDRKHLGKELEDYVSELEVPVKVLRTGKRSGLIRARLIGAEKAQAPVLTFLDAHCECTKGWLQPLLDRLVKDRTSVVCPVIDVISDETFEYIPASDMTWGGFNWKLNFRWYRVPQRELDRRKNDHSLPVRTPTMAGGLFSMDKQYFELLGKYDPGMEIWGGENLELSFRIWMCGGSLEIVTCSHVGHVFRKSTPYTFPGGTSKIVNHNNARLADVWLDQWRDFYFAINPAAKSNDRGDTTKRKELRRYLRCKSFKWYLTNIYPESPMPLEYYSLGEIRNINSNLCLDTYGRKTGEDAALSTCHGLGGNQVFAYTKRKQIMADDNCLDAPGTRENPVKLIRCHGMGGNQEWLYNHQNDDKSIVHVRTGLCLDVPINSSQSDSQTGGASRPLLRVCDGRESQQFKMKNNFQWQADS